MRRRAHAKRRDLNEPDVVAALRGAGCRVILLPEPVDLLVGIAGRTYLLEVKRGELAPADRTLTDAEAAFLAAWTGGPSGVIRCVEEALCVVGVRRCRQARANEAGYACDCGGVEDPPWFTAQRAAEKAANRAARKVLRGRAVAMAHEVDVEHEAPQMPPDGEE